jgi:hypothetical protein
VDAKPNPTARAMASQNWCESPEAHASFCDVKRSKGGDNSDSPFPREHVEAQTAERLKNGFTSAQHAGGWKTVLGNFDARDICTPSDIFNVQMKYKHLSLALRTAMEGMPGSKWLNGLLQTGCKRIGTRGRACSRPVLQ